MTEGMKFDEDKYEKVDLSLIPWKILATHYPKGKLTEIARDVYGRLNNPYCPVHMDLQDLFYAAAEIIPLSYLATALGYGEVKYDRDNWRKGFGGNPRQFLRACLRHCDAHLTGADYDGMELPGYPLGNCHKGAILFSLMVAMYEIVPAAPAEAFSSFMDDLAKADNEFPAEPIINPVQHHPV